MIQHRKSFYLLRHGQSTDNALGLISGAGSDCALTEMGQEQARAAKLIHDALLVKPAKIIVSGLKRTHQTAELAFGHTEFIIEPDFNERHLGHLDGKITEEEQKDMPVLPGEETRQEHSFRVHNALNKYLKDDDCILVVCHGGTIRRILEASGFKNMAVSNAAFYHVAPVGDNWNITCLNP